MGRRAGRPKKSTTDPIAPAAWDRIKRMVAQGVLDPVHATEIGRLSYLGELSAAQAAAGFRIGEIYGRYERITGKRRSARSPSYETGFSAPPTHESEDQMVAEQAARLNWERVQKEIPIEPPFIKGLVEDLCVEDRPINPLHIEGICIILDRVSRSFGTHGSTGNADPFATARIKKLNGAKAAAPARTPWGTIEHETWRIVMAKLRPDMCAEDIELAYVTFCALKDRARFRREVTKNKL